MMSEPFKSEITKAGPIAGDRQRVYLLPGQLHASDHPSQITTILGSCVAICLCDTDLRIGGMNHFLLPTSRDGAGHSMESTRFGDIATQELMQRLYSLGCRSENLRAKLFGGAALWQREDRYAHSLGARNVEAAQRMMNNCGIRVVAQDTGGNRGRKILFNTDDGSVWARQV
jgi:chemotaxis protein CheD